MSLRKKCPYSELLWSAFSRIRTEYGETLVSLRIQSKCRKMRTRITLNADTFYAVRFSAFHRFIDWFKDVKDSGCLSIFWF